MHLGLCVDHADPARWFTDRPTAGRAAAIAICSECPVRVDCLAYALARVDLAGIGGGTTAR
jgi:hypothetical protein